MWVYTYAYTDEELAILCQKVEGILEEEPLVSEDKRFLLYNILDYAEELKSQDTQEEWDALKAKAL